MTISTLGSPAVTALPDNRPILQSAPISAPAQTVEASPDKSDNTDVGLSVLRTEIREALRARFSLKFTSNGYESRVSAGAVVRESLSAASWLLRESPLEARADLLRLRGDIDRAGDAARRFAPPSQQADVDDALAKIDRGLVDFDQEAASNRPSSASVIDVEAKLRQRSTIRIRTQDGDIVTLSIRQRDAMSVEAKSGDGVSVVELETSSRSRMDLKVRGELDDGELEAIRSVFEKAVEIAKNFFGGDLAEAFDKAAGLEFDQAELARVSLKFRSSVESRIRLADLAPYPVLEPAAPATAPVVDAAQPVTKPGSDTPEPTVEAAVPAETAGAVPATAVPAETPAADEVPVSEARDAIASFVLQLKSFLKSTTIGFEKADGQRYFYAESFKLTLLKSVLVTATPPGGEAAAGRAVEVVDGLTGEARV